MQQKVWFLETTFQQIIGFLSAFWSQNPSKIDSEVNNFEKRKTFQNIAWASKNQSFAFQKLTENHEKILENPYDNKVHQKFTKYQFFKGFRPHFGRLLASFSAILGPKMEVLG